MNANVYEYIPEQKIRKSKRKQKTLSQDDIFILSALEKLQKDLENVHRSLDEVSDPDLIDSFVYELNAINMRYKVYLQMCKERGLVASMFEG
ncbi:MAG: YaaL family protein [Defluviitaleaceae bacterium]|nr:YaaL family protein [Defluviitaleaceae bacterium]